jgi:hypothetical protein
LCQVEPNEVLDEGRWGLGPEPAVHHVAATTVN